MQCNRERKVDRDKIEMLAVQLWYFLAFSSESNVSPSNGSNNKKSKDHSHHSPPNHHLTFGSLIILFRLLSYYFNFFF